MSSCSAPSDMAALTELITAATAESTAISSTGTQPPPEAYWPTTSPTAPKPTAAAVRRSRSRRGPDCGARLAASAPVVAKTPAPSAGPGSTPPSTATATASGAGIVTANRTTSRHGTGGGVVRTSSSSHAGARSTRSRVLRSVTPEACHRRPRGRGTGGHLQSGAVPVPLREVIAALDARYDPALAEGWDAVGLVCGDPDEPVGRVLFAVDPTTAVVDEVIAAGAGLLVTHHPLLLTPVHGVPADDPKGRVVHRLIRAGAALFVAHTNADRAPEGGVNDALAAVLGLTDAVPLEPAAGDPRAGLGRVGTLAEPLTLRAFAARAAAVLPATVGGVRAAGDPDRIVRRVAVCGGSGGSLTSAAAAAGADVLLTSDLKHHPVSEMIDSSGPALCDVAHFASEWPWLPVAADLLHRDLSGRVEVAVSRRRTDPWTWHEGSDGIPAGRSAG